MTEPAAEEAKRVRAAKREHLEEVVMDLNRALVIAIRKNQSKVQEMQEGTLEDAETTPNSSRSMNTVELQALCVFKLCEACMQV